jgi:hypothetical protein
MRIVPLALLAALLAPAALAQSPPKVDPKPYVDNTDLGFSIKVPKDWEFVPAQYSDAGNLIGRYAPKSVKYAMLDGKPLFLDAWLVKFDRRPRREAQATTDAGKLREAIGRADPDFATWAKGYAEFGSGLELESEDDFKAGKLAGKELVYNATTPRGLPVKIWAVQVALADDVDVAIVFRAPADKQKWGKWKTGLRKFGKSFNAVKVKQLEASIAVEGEGALRTAKRAELEAQVATQPGWELHETPNYFVITSSEDRPFIKEALQRLEAIREVYEVDYPLELAQQAHAARQRREAVQGHGDGTTEAPAGERSTVAAPDPLDQSRCSIVRICKSRDQYIEYGGSPRSAGYWNFVAEELVLYDDKALGGRENTWAVLNHEAFHQYIFYFYGNLSPHSWYNEGTGDFYSGYKLNSQKKFVLQRFEWREAQIKEEIKLGRTSPLEQLVRMSQGEYYASNELGNSRYPQGWSFIYFLRTGAQHKAKGWRDEWGAILATYLDALAETGDLNAAVERAFAGVDFEELEESWQDYVLKGK